jgi:SAM-dependent methyltransferase
MTNDHWWPLIHKLATELETAGIPYSIEGSTGLFVQGVDVPDMDDIDISVQWDQFETAHELFQPYGVGIIEQYPGWAKFHFVRDGLPVDILCYYNTVVEADPDRISVQVGGKSLFAKSVDFYRRHAKSGDRRLEAIRSWFQRKQKELSEHNGKAWNHNPYDAWVERYGSPNEAVQRILKDPAGRLKSIKPYFDDINGKKIVNLLGSHGSKAVALALLGAKVTVVDISSENARYAKELAEAAAVPLRYIVSDVLELPEEELTADYNYVFMELGILHYFIDLMPLTSIVAGLLRPGGKLILQDFHPISTKLITSKGKKHKVTGNYFNLSLERMEVAYSKLLSPDEPRERQHVLLRKWTLGEIVTSIAHAGLFIERLVEEPNPKLADKGIPKTFTLIAKKL